MKKALLETVLRVIACLLFLWAMAVVFAALVFDQPRMLIFAAVLFIAVMFFGAWSRRV